MPRLGLEHACLEDPHRHSEDLAQVVVEAGDDIDEAQFDVRPERTSRQRLDESLPLAPLGLCPRGL